MTEIGWNFPPNHYGQKEGLNDSGIEIFKGVPYESLAREVIQNSLDATLQENTAPVHVNFSLHNVPKSLFPHSDDFKNILKACKDEKPDHEETQKFFCSAIECIDHEEIPVLKVSDYNTTGLLGSTGEGEQKDWDNLIKSSGASDKVGSKGGSYGIGKNAPFACSKLRLVCYSTKDCYDNTAFQGVSILMTHKNSGDQETRGTGFYGKKQKNAPIYDLAEIDHFFRRDEVGTSLFIFGFSKANDWESEIIRSVLENYFVAIHEEKLVVKVNDTLINSTRLPELLEKNLSNSDEFLAPKFYQAIVSPHKYPFVEDDFFGMGKVEMYVLPERNYPKRVAMVRGTGMRIFNKDRFQTPIQFAGVFMARGDGINKFMRTLEPPSHRKWEPHRHDDVAYAKKMVKNIYKWINDQVKSIAVIDDSEDLEVEGLSEFLPDDSDDFEPELPEHQEGIEEGPPKNVEIRVVGIDPPDQLAEEGGLGGLDENQNGDILTGGGDRNNGEGGTPPTEPGDIVGGPGEDAINPNSEEKDMPSHSDKSILLKRVRLFSIDADRGVYRLNYLSNCSGNGYLRLKTVGDDGSNEPAPIAEVTELESGNNVEFGSDGRIGPILFDKEAPSSLEIILKDGLRCAMEVSANAA